MTFTLTIGILIAVLSLIFALQNTDIVEISFLVWDMESSIALVVIAALLAGFIVAFVIMTQFAFKSGMKVRELKKKISGLENKNQNVGIEYESEGLGSDSKLIKEDPVVDVDTDTNSDSDFKN